jgi:hypothetical protein
LSRFLFQRIKLKSRAAIPYWTVSRVCRSHGGRKQS